MFKKMNDKQKVFVLVGSVSFGFWLFYPMTLGYNFIDDILLSDDPRLDKWFDEVIQVLSFSVIIGCIIGFSLFKDK